MTNGLRAVGSTWLAEADLLVDPLQQDRDLAGALRRRRRQGADLVADEGDVVDHHLAELVERRLDGRAHRCRGRHAALDAESAWRPRDWRRRS